MLCQVRRTLPALVSHTYLGSSVLHDEEYHVPLETSIREQRKRLGALSG